MSDLKFPAVGIGFQALGLGLAENRRSYAVKVTSDGGRRGRPGLRGLIAVRIRPPMIRGHLTGDLERWLAPPNFSRFDAHSPKTGRLLARRHETGFKVSRPRHLVSGGARLLRASESSVPSDCNASWPGRKLILKILPHGESPPCGKTVERPSRRPSAWRIAGGGKQMAGSY